MLDHLHTGLRALLESGVEQEDTRKVILDAKSWQTFLVLQGEISELIREIEEPTDNAQLDVDTGSE